MALFSTSFNASDQQELGGDEGDPELVFRYSSSVTSWLVGAYVAIFVIGLVGNGFVVAVVHSTPRMRTTTNLLLVNLAVADILVLLICVPANLVANILLREFRRSQGSPQEEGGKQTPLSGRGLINVRVPQEQEGRAEEVCRGQNASLGCHESSLGRTMTRDAGSVYRGISSRTRASARWRARSSGAQTSAVAVRSGCLK